MAALSVEPVARRLGVSKGGFYHHFADRRALLRGALALWEEQFVADLATRFDAIEDPHERLNALLRHAVVELAPTVITKLMAANDDPDVAAALERATVSRLALLTRVFEDLGLPKALAHTRALLAYSAYIGLAQLLEQPASGLHQARNTNAYLKELETLLLAPPVRSP